MLLALGVRGAHSEEVELHHVLAMMVRNDAPEGNV
jgi:hypothetical protein